jgi:8-oxo-dGTP pyrophosphatase MutT (NUDIX family)
VDGEAEEDTLRREVFEECGCAVEIVQRIGFAIQYTFAGGDAYYAKQCAFFEVRLGERIAEPTEVDHTLVWVSIAEALELLVEESQRWAIEEALRTAT